MTELQKQFKKHYDYAMKLKEGGEAWEREMQIIEKIKEQILKNEGWSQD